MQSTLTSKKGITWQAVQQPTPEELTALIRDFSIEPVDAEFMAHEYSRPEITVRSDYILILTAIPVFNKQLRVTTGVPLYVVITNDKIATLQYEPIVVLDKLLQDFTSLPESQEERFGDGAVGVALYILNTLFASAFNKVARLGKHINIAEDAVFLGNERKMVYEISILVRDVMDFRKVIRPQRKLFAEAPKHPLMTDLATTSWLRLSGQINKLWEMLESLAESSGELSLVNSKLLQLKESELIQFLTYYSIFSIPIIILLNPLNPRSETATSFDKIVYWVGFILLFGGLLLILRRFRGKRVL